MNDMNQMRRQKRRDDGGTVNEWSAHTHTHTISGILVWYLRTHHRNACHRHSFPSSSQSFIILSERERERVGFDIWTVIFMIMLCHTTTCVSFWCVSLSTFMFLRSCVLRMVFYVCHDLVQYPLPTDFSHRTHSTIMGQPLHTHFFSPLHAVRAFSALSCLWFVNAKSKFAFSRPLFSRTFPS